MLSATVWAASTTGRCKQTSNSKQPLLACLYSTQQQIQQQWGQQWNLTVKCLGLMPQPQSVLLLQGPHHLHCAASAQQQLQVYSRALLTTKGMCVLLVPDRGMSTMLQHLHHKQAPPTQHPLTRIMSQTCRHRVVTLPGPLYSHYTANSLRLQRRTMAQSSSTAGWLSAQPSAMSLLVGCWKPLRRRLQAASGPCPMLQPAAATGATAASQRGWVWGLMGAILRLLLPACLRPCTQLRQ